MTTEIVSAVGSAVAQEGVSLFSSYISSKREDKASREQLLLRLDMSLSKLHFILEMTGKMTITCISLLRRRKYFECAYNEGTRLRNKHKLPVLVDELGQNLKDEEDMGQQVVTHSSVPFLVRILGRARSYTAFLPKKGNFTISSLLTFSKEEEYLSSSVVRNYEWHAYCADNFLRDVEFGSPLRLGAYRCPLVRHLLEGKTLVYEMVKKGRQSLFFHMSPVIVEGRGVEVELLLDYEDFRIPVKSFYLYLELRLSEDTDIFGISIKCLQMLTAQFKLAIESAIEQLMLLNDLQDISIVNAHPWCLTKENNLFDTKDWRPDPICCNGNSRGTLTNKLSMDVPEQVIDFSLHCYLPAPEFVPHNSTDEGGTNAPLLYIGSTFFPHCPSCPPQEIVLEYGGKEETKNGSLQEIKDMGISNALDYLVNEPEPTAYTLMLFSEHGGAIINFCKKTYENTWPKSTAGPLPRPSRRASKRKR